MKAIIMAGGKGTRIQEVTSEIPKPMIPIGGVPVLEREIISLSQQGIKDFIITISHLRDVIMNYFKDGKKLGVSIEYFIEREPLGNAGALFRLRDKLGEEPFLLLNGDVVFDIDVRRMIEYHRMKKSKVTILTHPNSHPYDSGLIVADNNNMVMQWLTKDEVRPVYYKNRVNAGIHIIEPSVLDETKRKYLTGNLCGTNYKVDLDRQVLSPLAGTGEMFCYDSTEYVKDMGTKERYLQVQKDFSVGLIEARNLKRKQKAVFLDRDGTINVYKGFLTKIDEFELISGVSESIKRINESGYLAIIVTNQPVLARGELTYEELEKIHYKLETLLGLDGAYIDGLYFCPHHPHKGYEGEVEALKIECMCRKPKPGMLLMASQDFNIDLQNSFMVGDSEMDIEAGRNAGCKTVLISSETSSFGQDITVSSLKEFVEKFI